VTASPKDIVAGDGVTLLGCQWVFGPSELASARQVLEAGQRRPGRARGSISPSANTLFEQEFLPRPKIAIQALYLQACRPRSRSRCQGAGLFIPSRVKSRIRRGACYIVTKTVHRHLSVLPPLRSAPLTASMSHLRRSTGEVLNRFTAAASGPYPPLNPQQRSLSFQPSAWGMCNRILRVMRALAGVFHRVL